MSHPLLRPPGSSATLLFRSRSLRRRAREVLERAAALRERSGRLLRGAADLPGSVDGGDREEAEALQWYRVQVREMLSAGWSRAELADVGVTDGLLRELGLHAAE